MPIIINDKTIKYLAETDNREALKCLADLINDPEDGTLLRAVAERGTLEAVKMLVTGGAKVDTTDANQWSALYLATRRGQDEIVEFLLEQGAHSIPTFSADTPLHQAVRRCRPETVRTMVNVGQRVDVNAACNPSKRTPIYGVDLDPRGVEMAQILMTAGATLNREDRDGISPLSNLVGRGNLDLVRLLIEEGKADPRSSDHQGVTVLENSAASKYISVLEYLITETAAKKDVNTANKGGRTPLFLAACGNSIKSAECLIKNGAEVDHVDNKGRTFLHEAVDRGHTDFMVRIVPLYLIASKKDWQGLSSRRTSTQLGHGKMLQSNLNKLLAQMQDEQ